MDERWKWSWLKLQAVTISTLLCVFLGNLSFCWSLNDEGLALLRLKRRVKSDPFNALSSWNYHDGDLNPCSWFGVECSHGKVVILKLRDLCLEGTLAPELGQLTHIKSIILRNNSFSGIVPKEFGELKELEELDLGYNNFTGPLPFLGNNLSLSILLLDNNKHICSIPPELYDLMILSESQVDENRIVRAGFRASCNRGCTSWFGVQHGDIAQRRLLQRIDPPSPTKVELESDKQNQRSQKSSPSSTLSPSPSSLPPAYSPISFTPFGPLFRSISIPPAISMLSPTEAPSPSQPELLSPSRSPVLPPNLALPPLAKPPVVIVPEESSHALSPSFTLPPSGPRKETTLPKNLMGFILPVTIGGSVFILILVLILVYCQRNKVVTVKPWATGLSGQLQKAFVTGVPKLQRSELETACEDFSNIIDCLSDGTVYKGTLSSGVEIAVASSAVKSAKDWSKNFEVQFRNKIDILSKVNHKNFVNLIGYCEEEEPFSRMMVFEYAPSGTLFEHLHIKESEHLDWGTRLRIAMGMAYCLEYMHQLTPPIAHRNMQSSSIYLTEDYAAKISDFSFWNEVIAAKRSATLELLETPSVDPETNVYSFGLILLEMITGRLPYSAGNGSLVDWALYHWREGKPLRELVDPTLISFQENELEKLFELIKDCLLPKPKQRPAMREITAKLKEITTLGPDRATPKSSPLWWAELEILSTASS